MLEPFVLRALAAAIGLAIIAAPLGAFVVWNRLAYFGETVAQAGLLGVALALFLAIDTALGVLVATLLVALLLFAAGRQTAVPLDAVLGLTHHGALAAGVIATALMKGPAIDYASYLFGDIFTLSVKDLVILYVGGIAVLAVTAAHWSSLLRLAVHEELAEAEGVARARVRLVFMLLLAAFVALAMKIAGLLLVMAFLVVPAVAARPFADGPERMVLLSASIGVVASVAGLFLSVTTDAPGGASIVLVMAMLGLVAIMLPRARGS